ncbi:alkene reductase [Mucilaginibacter sp. UR6-11]|uniref:alkene reductase n=1 Tax=Mucilaginibacter sp. UR6-11 TaxID=1435644 RepID=UPI001E5F401B|nr:alkene reductase [Mucilaginibacter sp. UR6-11]MCC8426858.1 alkene reductase [Mucilaginibacter sp. UR6-11]
MENNKLFEPAQVGAITLKNRIVMSPMTRCRAIGNVPNDLMAKYYGQRANAGLIITEGTSPSPNGLGYARIPGIYSDEQIVGWKKVTSAVHEKGGKIVIQLMHTGRISHPANMPEGAVILAPSAVKPAGQMWTDTLQMQDFPMPKAMTADELNATKAEFVAAAKNAIIAGFDGVELHGANGYLLEQFLSPISNVRTDEYGGSVENRARFVLEVVSGVAAAIGKDRTGIRLSPYGVASDMPHYPEIDATYSYLAEQLNQLGIAFIHIVDHSAMGAPAVPLQIKQTIRNKFKNIIILAGGHSSESAQAELESGLGDLAAFGRPFINNPDLVERFAKNVDLSTDLDMTTFYTADEKGYTDYPFYQ